MILFEARLGYAAIINQCDSDGFQLILIFLKRILQFNIQLLQPFFMTNIQCDHMFKVLTIGSSSVGKSSLLLRYANNYFHQGLLPSIGVDLKIKILEHEGSFIKLQMWDYAAQSQYKNLTSAYYKGAHGVILIFDICDKRTFQNIKKQIVQIESNCTIMPAIILVANKCDREEQRQVSHESGEMLALKEGMTYFECSAKTNKNVDMIFTKLATQMKKRFCNIPDSSKTTNIKLLPISESERKGFMKRICR